MGDSGDPCASAPAPHIVLDRERAVEGHKSSTMGYRDLHLKHILHRRATPDCLLGGRVLRCSFPDSIYTDMRIRPFEL